MKKILGSITMAAVLSAGLISSASAGYSVNATLKPDVNVNIDGTNRDFYNAQGQEVFPIMYNGSTYLPLRAIGELMNKNVNWNATTKTASVGGQRVTQNVVGTPNNNAQIINITPSCYPEYIIEIDGTVRNFKDANGNAVYPLNYNGSIYLPIRAIGEIMGKNVSWDGATQTVILNGAQSNGSDNVTDFDTSGNNNNNAGNQNNSSNNNQNGTITLDRAKQIALNHAGKNVSEVQFIKAHKDWNKYEIEFVTNTNGVVYEYDYDISMNGQILSYDQDIEGYFPNNNGQNGNNQNQGGNINLDKAKQIALNHAGKTASEVNFVKAHQEWDDGMIKYEVQFITTSNGVIYEYDYDISANGTILSYDYDIEGYVPNNGNGNGGVSTGITQEKAKQIALSKVAGATTANIYEFKLDKDHGRYVYEGKIIYGTMEYEFEIDANTGNIIDWDVDSIYD